MLNALVGNIRLASIFTLLLLVAGFGALYNLPRMEDPHIINRFASVVTHFPGASAERIEVLVTEVLENKLKQLEEIRLITSTSRSGISVITLELKQQITETASIWSKTRDFIADGQLLLPQDARNSRLNDQVNYTNTVIFALTWNDNSEPRLDILNRYAKELKNQLRLIPTTDFTNLHGNPTEEILVELDANKVNRLQLSPQIIASRIKQADPKISAGEINNDHFKAQIEVSGELDSLERIRQIPLKVDSSGQIIRLMDLAKTTRQIKTPMSETAIINGKLGIMISARMLHTVRIDHWLTQVNEKINHFKSGLPSNIAIEYLFEQESYTNKRLEELTQSLLIGFTLILCVLMLTLGLKNALIVAISLPLTVLFTLASMNFIGLPIHQMSITGLVLALGIMVDNAIVITDAISQRRQKGLSTILSIKQSLNLLWRPLAGSTLTTMLAFAPIAMIPGATGEFIGGLAISVILTLLGSYLISHTLIAGLAGRVKPNTTNNAPWYQTGIKAPAITYYFKLCLSSALNRPITSAILIGIFPLIGFIAVSKMTEQFFPPADRDMFHIEVYFSPKNSLQQSVKQVIQIDAELKNRQDIKRTDWIVGSNVPSFYYNLASRNQGTPYYAQAMVTVNNYQIANQMIPSLQTQLNQQYPDAQFIVRRLEQGPPFNAPIEVRIYGPNLEQLKLLGDELRTLLSQHPDVLQTRTSLISGQPKIWFEINEDAAFMSGLSLTDVANQIKMSTLGSTGGSIIEDTENLPVRIKLSAEYNNHQEKLSQLQLLATNGNRVPLSAISETTVKANIGEITRWNNERINVVEAYLSTSVLPAKVLAEIKPLLSQLDLSNNYRIEIGGESAKRNEAVGDLLSNILLIITLLFAIMVITFNSYRLTFIVILSAIQSAGLGLLAVYLFNYPFGFTVIVGLLGLIGLAINASIVILADLKDRKSTSHHHIINTVSDCGRHIISTTVTTVGGFLPLIIAGGGFWPPFALTIAGGTLLTSLISLIWVPVMYSLLVNKK